MDLFLKVMDMRRAGRREKRRVYNKTAYPVGKSGLVCYEDEEANYSAFIAALLAASRLLILLWL